MRPRRADHLKELADGNDIHREAPVRTGSGEIGFTSMVGCKNILCAASTTHGSLARPGCEDAGLQTKCRKIAERLLEPQMSNSIGGLRFINDATVRAHWLFTACGWAKESAYVKTDAYSAQACLPVAERAHISWIATAAHGWRPGSRSENTNCMQLYRQTTKQTAYMNLRHQ